MSAPTREQVEEWHKRAVAYADDTLRTTYVATAWNRAYRERFAALAFAAGAASRPVPTTDSAGPDVLTEEECNVIWAEYDDLDDQLQAAARIGAERERERAARVAMDHECGGEDDITCRGQNCGMCIAAAIRRGEG